MKEEKLTTKEKAAIARDLFERYRRGETSSDENEVVELLEAAFIPEKEFEITNELIEELDSEITDFIFQKIKKTKRRILLPAFIGSVAGVVLLIIGIFMFYKLQPLQPETIAQQNITTDTITNILLTDGTEIVLNSGTSLRENLREVWFDEGEALFNVKPDTAQPFIVYLRNGITVRVLGTSFTIQSYAELPFQEISVLNGKVNVSTQNKQSMDLMANQQATYNKAKKELVKESINSMQKAAWRTGTIVLENATVDELRLRIHQLYKKNILFENQPVTMSINITLDKTTAINEIAAEIATLYNFSYQITGDKIVFQSPNATKLP